MLNQVTNYPEVLIQLQEVNHRLNIFQTSGQAEALDLSKRNTPPIRPSLSQSHPVSVGILQSHQPLPSRKLLEKALTSGLLSSDFQLGPMSTSHTVSRHTDQSSSVLSGIDPVMMLWFYLQKKKLNMYT